jgi:hypothetical protein
MRRRPMIARHFLLARLLISICFVCLSVHAQELSRGQVPPTPTAGLSHSGNSLSSLPLDAQSAISGLLGQNIHSYAVRSEGKLLEVSNTNQHFVAEFAPGKVRLQSESNRWQMELASFGYGSSLHTVSSARPVAAQNRVEYAYSRVKEWYVNGPAGLEQGFTVENPSSRASVGPLTLALKLSGNLVPRLSGHDGLVLSDHDGNPVLRYGGLTSHDAGGKTLQSWLELEGSALLLRVQDRGAIYPVTIDPITQLAELTASAPAVDADLGYSVSISGNTVAVGVRGIDDNQGAVYVFVKPGTGWANMHETAVLTASDGASGNLLGYSVAISGEVVVAGAPFATIGSNPEQGGVYVFQEPSGGWTNMTQTAKLTASDGGPGDWLGFSVSISGSTVAAGASQGYYLPAAGKAYVFVQPSLVWVNGTETAELTVSGGSANAQLGFSVSTTGGTVVAGAPYEEIGTNYNQGAAFVFVAPSGGWSSETQTAELTASDGASGDNLGSSASIDGSTIVLGAPNATVGSNSQQGKVYVFVEPSGGWASNTQTAELTASDGAAGDNLGHSVSISGTVAIAGASCATISGNACQGAVYLYIEPSGGWANETQNAKIASSDGAAGDNFGISVSLDGTVGAVGAPFKTVGGDSQAGEAYVFGTT